MNEEKMEVILLSANQICLLLDRRLCVTISDQRSYNKRVLLISC